MKIQGKFLYYDVINANDRMYTKECAENIVKQFGELDHPVFGQLGYPDADNFKGNLSDFSHKVKEIHINTKTHAIEGTIEILEGTPNGKKLLKMLKNKLTIWDKILNLIYKTFNKTYKKEIINFNDMFVVRSRGTGEINENKEITNYNIISFDVVPKDTDAFAEASKPLKLE